MNTNKLLEPHDFGRHGEVVMKKVEKLPAGAKLVEEGKSIIVGHSESGHHHVLTVPRTDGVIRMYEVDGKTYLDLPARGELTHQKSVESHGTQVFEKGIYLREIRQSYSYAEKIMRRVSD